MSLIAFINSSLEKLPAKLLKNPDAYILCKRTQNSLKVGVFNCYLDEIVNPIIELDKEYSSIVFANSNGKLDKNKVITNKGFKPFGG